MNDREKAITPYTYVVPEKKVSVKKRTPKTKRSENEWRSVPIADRQELLACIRDRMAHERMLMSDAALRALSALTAPVAGWWRQRLAYHQWMLEQYHELLDPCGFTYPSEIQDRLVALDRIELGLNTASEELVQSRDAFIQRECLRMARLDLQDMTNAASWITPAGEEVQPEHIVEWRKLSSKQRGDLKVKQAKQPKPMPMPVADRPVIRGQDVRVFVAGVDVSAGMCRLVSMKPSMWRVTTKVVSFISTR